MKKYTVVFTEFPELKEYLLGNKTMENLNEVVFNNGFIPCEWQRQWSPKFNSYIWVFHGYGTLKFFIKERKRIKNKHILKGWDLFLQEKES